ncbi:hypothetical protein TFLX_04093 [Thermoflexales bacterium]|nr:hypothetical protein TFLX_04093 [Thermoflexales bacterium]
MVDPISPSPQVQARILIVDDHPNTGFTLARILEGTHPSVEILTALNGQEALAIVGEGVDVLIVDYLMPDMTGSELIELSQRVQVDDYLVKPVHPKQIRGLVDKIFKGLRAGTIPVISAENYIQINYKAAQAQGLTAPEGLLRQAHEVIR